MNIDGQAGKEKEISRENTKRKKVRVCSVTE
jgi:hypothetical protein